VTTIIQNEYRNGLAYLKTIFLDPRLHASIINFSVLSCRIKLLKVLSRPEFKAAIQQIFTTGPRANFPVDLQTAEPDLAPISVASVKESCKP
jgi:hypothetical protein